MPVITLPIRRCGDPLHRGEIEMTTSLRSLPRVLRIYGAEALRAGSLDEFIRLNMDALRLVSVTPARLRAAIERGEAIIQDEERIEA